MIAAWVVCRRWCSRNPGESPRPARHRAAEDGRRPHRPPVPAGISVSLLLCVEFPGCLRAAVTAVDGQGRLRGFIGRCVHGMLRQRFAPLLLAAPLAALLTATPWWQPWHGIPAPIVGLVPSGPSLIAFGGAFLLGWFLHREQAHWAPGSRRVAVLGTGRLGQPPPVSGGFK